MEPMTGYAYTFDGYFRLEARDKQGAFRAALDELGVCYDDTRAFLSLHNRPSKLFDRENTILFPAADNCARRWFK